MEKRHILLVCPDGKDFNLIKQTGVLALALRQAKYQLSLAVGGVRQSLLSGLEDGVRVTHFPPMQIPLKGWFGKEAQCSSQVIQMMYFKKCLQRYIGKDTTIDIAHLMDCRFPFSQLAQVPQKLHMPVIANVHHHEDITAENVPFWQRDKHKKALQSMAPLVVSSSSLLEKAHKNGLDNVVYIPHGIRVDHFKPVLSKRPVRRSLGLPEKPTLICCMADITPQNAQLEMIERCYPLSEMRQIVFIAQEKNLDYLEKIKNKATEKGIQDYIHIVNAENQPESYLRACDVFMLLGGIEQRHTTILEAQSAGLPVVLGPSESSLMLCNGNRSGVVLYPHNPLAKQAFEKILSDPTYRQGRAMNARPFVVKQFSFEEMMQAYNRLYQSL